MQGSDPDRKFRVKVPVHTDFAWNLRKPALQIGIHGDSQRQVWETWGCRWGSEHVRVRANEIFLWRWDKPRSWHCMILVFLLVFEEFALNSSYQYVSASAEP
jgi:hypothetical protein